MQLEYTPVPTSLLDRYQQLGLQMTDVVAIIQILRLADENHELSTTAATLARQMGVSDRTVRRMLSNLVELGLLIRETPAIGGFPGGYLILSPLFQRLEELASTDVVLTASPGTDTLLQKAIKQHGDRCLSCGTTDRLTADHVVPGALHPLQCTQGNKDRRLPTS
jgi:DNA-binding IscR family transcriptional regulator